MSPARPGRRPADRRVPGRPTGVAATSGTVGPGVVVARPAAIEPAGGHRAAALARLRRARLRPPAGERRGGRRAPDQGQGPGRLLERQPLVGRLRDRGDPVHAARRRDGGVRVRDADLGPHRGGPRHHRRLVPADHPRLPERRRQLHRRAREPRRRRPGLVAAAALLTDYVLTVSVSVAAGVAAITSAFPGALDGLRVEISARRASSLVMLDQPARRPRERDDLRDPDLRVRRLDARRSSGSGMVRTAARRRRRRSPASRRWSCPPRRSGVLLLMRAFADGCSAITGVEAVSNGVPAFRSPESVNARTTLSVMGVLVGVMFLGTSLAGRRRRRRCPPHGETVLSQLGRAVFGAGAALLRPPALDDGHPHPRREHRVRRLPAPVVAARPRRVHAEPVRVPRRAPRLQHRASSRWPASSIVVLAAFGGRVEALIPLYAIGVFTSITLSQAGMVRHWWRTREPGWRRSLVINGFGAVATGDRDGRSSRSPSSRSGRG